MTLAHYENKLYDIGSLRERVIIRHSPITGTNYMLWAHRGNELLYDIGPLPEQII